MRKNLPGLTRCCTLSDSSRSLPDEARAGFCIAQSERQGLTELPGNHLAPNISRRAERVCAKLLASRLRPHPPTGSSHCVLWWSADLVQVFIKTTAPYNGNGMVIACFCVDHSRCRDSRLRNHVYCSIPCLCLLCSHIGMYTVSVLSRILYNAPYNCIMI